MPGMLEVLPQLVGNRGLAGLQLVIAEPGKWALKPKVDGLCRLQRLPRHA